MVTENEEVPFGSNEVRLTLRQWGAAALIAAAVLTLAPLIWRRIEPLTPGADYRLPYRLGNDYWLYARACRLLCTAPDPIPVFGDSVVWGHYVSNDRTLTHYLNAEFAGKARFLNLGVDGIHPAALDGLITHYARPVRRRRVLLHCNLLWMSSPRQDLRTRKEFAFNHPDLVPQFFPRIPCYRRPLSERLGTVIDRNLPAAGWVKHLRIAYFDGRDLPSWTLEHPYADPFARFARPLPAPAEPPSPRPPAKSWTERGLARFDAPWVDLRTSIQWQAFKRAVHRLRSRGNRVFVILGPFNEHMLTPDSWARYLTCRQTVLAWLEARRIPHAAPQPLPGRDYADASHPLAPGYALLAKRLALNPVFRRFLGLPQKPNPE